MSDPIIVLALDLTASDPSNLITGELQSPPPGAKRLVLPAFGAFYKKDLVIKDNVSGLNLTSEQYQLHDFWQEASADSGQAVFSTILLTDPAVSGDISLTYRAFGGPQSRNAQAILDWLAQRMAPGAETINFIDLTDIPKAFRPSQHLHLLEHVYGMEYIRSALRSIKTSVETGSNTAWSLALQDILDRIKRLQTNSVLTVQALVQQRYQSWQSELNLFTLGLDLLFNKAPLEDGSAATRPDFFVTNEEDDRYVDLRGLGSFAKSMVERVVLSEETGLGMTSALMSSPQRGSIVAAPVGAVFTLPSPAEAATLVDYTSRVYPKNFPDTHRFVIQKLAGNQTDFGSILMGFDAVSSAAYIGVMASPNCDQPLTWSRFYGQDDMVDFGALITDHVQANNNPHETTKDQIELGNVEDLPVVTEDDILTQTSTRKFVTLDTLKVMMQAFSEGVKLTRNELGQIDYEANPMNDAKILFAPCKDKGAAAFAPKDQFIKSWCDGVDKYVRMTDGAGSYYDKLVEANSVECQYFDVPKQGTSLGEFCEGVNRKIKYADGRGGVITEITKINSVDCGYVEPQAAGTQIAVFCSGVNQMVRRADGQGGFYDLPSMINTTLCGGVIAPAGGAGTGSTGGGTGGTSGGPSILLASTNTEIYSGTTEIISVYFQGLTPNVSYTADLYIKSPALGTGAADTLKTKTFTFNAKTDGTYGYNITVYDDGTTVPRGVYDNWCRIESESLESNHITRTFNAGVNPKPNDLPDPNKPPIPQVPIVPGGAGDKGLDGNAYPTNPYWPPPAKYNPNIELTSSQTVISPGSNEVVSAKLQTFFANTSYTAEFWVRSPAYNGGQAVKTFEQAVQTDKDGGTTATLNQYDNGVVPRGVYDSWVQVGTTESNHITRTFVTGDLSGAGAYNPKMVLSASNAVVTSGVTETFTLVMTGFDKNKNYQVVFVSNFSIDIYPTAREILTVVVTTDASGNFRFETSTTDDGVTTPRNNYRIYASIQEVGLRSNDTYVTYASGIYSGAPGTQVPKLDIASTNTQITKGTTETITIRLTQAPASQTFAADLWVRSSAVNNGVAIKTATVNINTNSLGTGTATLVQVDDGITVPRGDYVCWAVVPELNSVMSSSITRSFIGVSGGTPAPTSAPNLANAHVTFSTSHPTIVAGTAETLTSLLTGFLPNTTYTLEYWGNSAALNNGGQNLKSRTDSVTTNSSGAATVTLTQTDDGVTVPRGEYRSWVVVSGVQSNTIIRTFAGTPPPSTVYNPTLSFSSTYSTISAGVTETLTVELKAARPNTSYTFQYWARSSAYNNNANTLLLSVSVVTDNNGRAIAQRTQYDDGTTVPRGVYTSWAAVPELAIESNYITRTFIGTPAPTAPPYNPSASASSDHYIITPGTSETIYISISGLRPNTTYSVQLWTSSPSLYGGTPLQTGSVSVTTNGSGSGNTTVAAYDDGTTVPRGTYTNWVIISETGTSSQSFTRVFQSG